MTDLYMTGRIEKYRKKFKMHVNVMYSNHTEFGDGGSKKRVNN